MPYNTCIYNRSLLAPHLIRAQRAYKSLLIKMRLYAHFTKRTHVHVMHTINTCITGDGLVESEERKQEISVCQICMYLAHIHE